MAMSVHAADDEYEEGDFSPDDSLTAPYLATSDETTSSPATPTSAVTSLHATDDEYEEFDTSPDESLTAPCIAPNASQEPFAAADGENGENCSDENDEDLANAETHDTLLSDAAADAAWKVLGRIGTALSSHEALAVLRAALGTPAGLGGRQRDLFPLGLLSSDELALHWPSLAAYAVPALNYLNGVILGLNWLYGLKASVLGGRRHSGLQLAALNSVVTSALELHAHLVQSFPDRDAGGWSHFERGATAAPLRLDAAAVAVPDCAGTCNPTAFVAPEAARRFSSASSVFPSPPDGLDRFSGFYAGERQAYVDLTVRQLRVGLLELRSCCRGGGTVFPVAKTSLKQRLVWHGTRVSDAAAPPPPPRHLADPAAFGFLELSEGRALRVTKRDCQTWFDQLAAPAELRAFFGRPRVYRAELLAAGLCEAELREVVTEGSLSSASFVPCATAWPMGFSWSSHVAQEALLTIADHSGLGTDRVLASDAPLPLDLDLAFAVATDDLMIFSDRGVGSTVSAADSFETSLLVHGAAKNPEKDVNDVLTAVCVGVELVDGTHWKPPGHRLWLLLDAILDLSATRCASPAATAA